MRETRPSEERTRSVPAAADLCRRPGVRGASGPTSLEKTFALCGVGLTDGREAARLLRQHERGARDHAKRIWALVCLELWAREHVDRAGRREQACA